MLKMNSCIYKGEKFFRKKSKGLKISGNDLKRSDIRTIGLKLQIAFSIVTILESRNPTRLK